MKAHKQLLVIRLSAMGDVAMSVPVLKAFCEHYPEVQVTVLTRIFFFPLFSQLPNVRVYAVDVKGRHKGFIGLIRLYKELGSKEFGTVIDLHNVLRSNILKIFFRFSGCGFFQLDKGRNEKKALIKGQTFEQLKTTHERYADVFAKAGYPFKLSASSVLKKELFKVKILERWGIELRIAVGIAPFAAFKGKMYPIYLMEKVIAGLSESNRYSILLFGGGQKEMEQLSFWEKNYQNVRNASIKLTFEEELQLISNLKVMLAMDSGNGHLAAMYGVKTITLWGVTHPYLGFIPFGQPLENSLLADRSLYPAIPTSAYGNKMPKGYEKAMETILPELIIKRIADLTA